MNCSMDTELVGWSHPESGGQRLSVQRRGRCCITGDISGRVGQGSEQPDLAEDVPAYCRGVELDDL